MILFLKTECSARVEVECCMDSEIVQLCFKKNIVQILQITVGVQAHSVELEVM